MEDYYDIEAILAEDQNVKCVFHSNVPGLSWLEGGQDDMLKAGSRVDIPYWLAREIVVENPEKGQLTVGMGIELPEFFGPKVRNGLRAEATVVDLPKLCPNFFRFATHYLQLIEDEKLTKALIDAFMVRLQLTMDHTQSGGSSNTTEYLNRLDDTERELYKAGLESSASLNQWNQQSFGRIRSANEVILKRKFGV